MADQTLTSPSASNGSVGSGDAGDRSVVDLNFVDRSALVAQLDLTADQAEVIASNQIDIEAKFMVDGDGVVDIVGKVDVVVVVEVEVRVLDEHDAGIDANIH